MKTEVIEFEWKMQRRYITKDERVARSTVGNHDATIFVRGTAGVDA